MSAKSDIPEGWYFMSDGMTSDGAENQGGSIKTIQAAFIQFDRRAEKLSQDLLAKTFVDAEPLFIQLSSRNHQVLYGRRGTGKTHALKFLGDSISANGDAAIYIDLRTIGSNGSIYSDTQRSLPERATRLQGP
jgi:Cdc6-like AAA superfamily ATPase